MDEPSFLQHEKTPGPVITISREVGCNGMKVARALAEKLNNENKNKTWRVLSKEVFHESARELDLEYERIVKLFKTTDRYALEDILYAFGSRNFKSGKKIIKTVVDIIHSFAFEGHCIIVGRAGHIIARDIENSLHLRFVAPLEFRIQTIMHNNGLTREEAINFINKVEKERMAFRKAIGEVTRHHKDFDLVINRGFLNREELIDLITRVMEIKKMLVEA
jgi:cytidylate kinase